MILATAATLPALGLGWLLVRAILPPAIPLLLQISLAAGLGIGASSVIYFALLWAGLAILPIILGTEAAAIVIAALVWRRTKRTSPAAPVVPGRIPWIWPLRIAALAAVAIFITDFSQSTAANPHGEWDAFSVWNLRAKYLAGGEPTWRHAFTGESGARMTGANHPGYPLLTSGFIARTWVVSGQVSPAAPSIVSLLFALATAGLLFSALGLIASEAAGLMGVLVLLATEAFVSQAASQYADIPLGFYILATLSLLTIAGQAAWPRELLALAGLAAGFAAWTKNEGLPFLAIVLALILWRGGFRAITWIAAGAVPGALVTAAFKLFLVHGDEAVLPKTFGEVIAKLADFSRWIDVSFGLLRGFLELGVLWAHPILLLAILGFALGFAPREIRTSRLWIALAPLGLLAADFAVYMVTTADLKWHLSTSVSRVIAQVWPGLVFIVCAILKPPAVQEQRKHRK